MTTTTKYDSYYCPCGCGNHTDRSPEQEQVDSARKHMKGHRFCMDPETTKIFLPSVEDIKKHGYKTVGQYTLEEFLGNAETEHQRWAATSLYRIFTSNNAYADSEENRIEK